VPATVIVWAIIEELWPAPETPQPAELRQARGGRPRLRAGSRLDARRNPSVEGE
jgi:hypothetical protein